MGSLGVWITVAIVVVTVGSILFTVFVMKWSWGKSEQLMEKSMGMAAEQQQKMLNHMGPMMDSQKAYLDAIAEKQKDDKA